MSKPTILIVESGDTIFSAANAHFGDRFGWIRAQTAADGLAQYLNCYETHRVTLALIDSRVPDFSKQLDQIKHEQAWIKVAAVATEKNHEQLVDMMRNQCDDVFVLPFNPATFQKMEGWALKASNQVLDTISFFSATGRGQMAHDERENLKSKLRELGIKDPDQNLGKGTVLVVDDEEIIRDSVADYLEPEGYQVLQAANSDEAISLVLDHPEIELVVSDIRMPGLHGDKLLRVLKKINPDLGIVMLTAFKETEIAVDTFKFGAIDYLNKPITRAILLEKVASAIESVRSSLNSNFELPLKLRLNYLDQFCVAAQQFNRQILNKDVAEFLPEITKFNVETNAAFDRSLIEQIWRG